MIDFLSMLNIDYIYEKMDVDNFIKELIAEKNVVKEWSSSAHSNIIDIKRYYSKDVYILLRSVLDEKEAMDIRLFIVLTDGGQFNNTENIRVSYNSENILALGYTERGVEKVPLNFVINNVEDYEKAITYNLKVTGVYLTSFSSEAMVVFPVEKAADEGMYIKEKEPLFRYNEHEENPGEEVPSMTRIEELLKTEDVLTVLDSYFFPIKDFDTMYSVLAEILDVEKTFLRDTKAFLYKLKIRTMDTLIDVFINERDLLGEPSVGMRFKGNIWLQGKIAFV